MRRAPIIAAIFALLLAGCPEPPRPPPAVPSPPVKPPAADAPVALGAGSKWGDFVSKRFGVRIPLPDGQAWRIDDHAEGWLVARHPSSESALVVRTWREDASMSRARCEERARLWRKLPERDGADIVEKKAVNVPPDFDTVVEVGVVPSPEAGKKPGAGIAAFVMAFGGRAHRCFAYVFTTSARGHGAEAAVGERLATMEQGSLEGLVLESDLEPRIPREGSPGGPAP